MARPPSREDECRGGGGGRGRGQAQEWQRWPIERPEGGVGRRRMERFLLGNESIAGRMAKLCGEETVSETRSNYV